MPEKKPGNQDKASSTTRRRARLSADDDGGRVSRPLLVALVVILAGGAYLFWPHGGTTPGGIGEQRTVVTADTTSANAPRSGNVEITGQQMPLVAEKPAAESPKQTESKPVEVATETAPAPQPEKTPARREAPKAATGPMVEPRPAGPWAVQVGAYKTEVNADALVERFAAKEINAHVRVASTAAGDLVYRVWIGWFTDREEALAFCRQEKDRIGEAYPVHR